LTLALEREPVLGEVREVWIHVHELLLTRLCCPSSVRRRGLRVVGSGNDPAVVRAEDAGSASLRPVAVEVALVDGTKLILANPSTTEDDIVETLREQPEGVMTLRAVDGTYRVPIRAVSYVRTTGEVADPR
jgi:hypothetical protein